MSTEQPRAALILPGQGSQKEGSAASLGPRGREVFERASAACGLDLLELATTAKEEELRWPSIIQPLLVAHAQAAVLDSELDLGVVSYVVGHSSGENSAAVLSGALDFEEGVRFAYQRGLLLDEACRQVPSGLTALIDLDEEVVSRICEESGVALANLNGPAQTVIGGTLEQLAAAKRLAEAEGATVVELRVAGAFHTPLMAKAEQAARKLVEGLDLRDPARPLVGNREGQIITSADALRAELMDQFLRPVIWRRSVEFVLGEGVRKFYVAGPGSAMFGLVRRIAQHLKIPVKAEKI